MAETPTGGLQIIREACTARASVHATIARDCGVSIDLLGSFAQGNANLPPDILNRVVKFIWRDWVEYNAEADALQAVAQPEARGIGVRPTWNIPLQKFAIGPLQRNGPQPEVAAPPKPKPRGWIGTVWE